MTDRTTTEQSRETRQSRRAFRNAMTNGLKAAYDPVASRSVPDDFMELLKKADRKRA